MSLSAVPTLTFGSMASLLPPLHLLLRAISPAAHLLHHITRVVACCTFASETLLQPTLPCCAAPCMHSASCTACCLLYKFLPLLKIVLTWLHGGAGITGRQGVGCWQNSQCQTGPCKRTTWPQVDQGWAHSPWPRSVLGTPGRWGCSHQAYCARTSK